jgi:hypothetical protein
MPVRHFLDLVSRLVITQCSGEVCRDEIVESLTNLRGNPDFHPDFRQLADLSQVSTLKLGFNDMEAILRLYDPFSNKGRRAMVAPGNSTNFGLARMYQSLVDDPQFEVFQSLIDAITWLGLEIATVEEIIKRESSKPHARLHRKMGRGATER